MKKSNLHDPGREHLEKAAQQVIETFKSPIELLHFLTDALGWVYGYGIDAGDKHPGDTHYLLQQMIGEIATPWLNGRENLICNMADGIGELSIDVREEFYLDGIKYLIRAYGWQTAAMGNSNVESTMLDMDGIICLMSMVTRFRSYHVESKAKLELA